MSLMIVPNALSDAIYAAVDKALAQRPEMVGERENIYMDLLRYYDEHGVIPEFTLEPAVREVTGE